MGKQHIGSKNFANGRNILFTARMVRVFLWLGIMLFYYLICGDWNIWRHSDPLPTCGETPYTLCLIPTQAPPQQKQSKQCRLSFAAEKT